MSRKKKIWVVFDSPQDPDLLDLASALKEEDWKTERHVLHHLEKMGYAVEPVGLCDSLAPLQRKLAEGKPNIIFNLVETFNRNALNDRNVVGFYELMGLRYTGSNPTGLMLCKNKGVAKQILSYHRIKTPAFAIFHRGHGVRVPKKLKFPILIKPLREEASYGISQSSVVNSEKEFLERVAFVQENMEQDAIAEEYIVGRELYVSTLGNKRLRVLPIRELCFGNIPDEEKKIATFRLKWDQKYRQKWGITYRFASLDETVRKKIEKICKRVHRYLYIKGYGRIDLRLTPSGEIYIIEANPNPFLAEDEDFALSALAAGIKYPDLLRRILDLGLRQE